MLAGDGSHTASASVFCPARSCSVDADKCRKCAHVHFVSPESVVCSPPNSTLPEGMDAPAGSAALSDVTLVRADVRWPTLIILSQAAPWPLPVVDSGDRFIGFVPRGLLATPTLPWHQFATTLAGELAAEESLVALETETVGDALRLMARRGARSIALVDPSGLLRGIVCDVDALQAIAADRG